MVQDTAALEAAIHEIAQMDHQRIQVAATVAADPLDQLLDRAQQIEPPVHVAHGVDPDPARHAGVLPATEGWSCDPLRERWNRRFSTWNAGLATSSDMMNLKHSEAGLLLLQPGDICRVTIHRASVPTAEAKREVVSGAPAQLSEERCLGNRAPITNEASSRPVWKHHRARQVAGRRSRADLMFGPVVRIERAAISRFLSEVA